MGSGWVGLGWGGVGWGGCGGGVVCGVLKQLKIKNLFDTPAQESNTENKTPPPGQPGDDASFCHRAMTTKRESVEQSSESKQGARELEP